MKARLYFLAHESNGLGVEVLPETEDEQTLLDALWKFGEMETTYSSDNPRAKGYVVKAFKHRS